MKAKSIQVPQAHLRFSTNGASSESLSRTLATKERVARNCSCAITAKPREAEGLRNVASPGGGVFTPFVAKPAIAFPACTVDGKNQ